MNEAVRNPATPTNGPANAPIIEIENLSISFFTRKGEIPAVMDFSCTVMPGEAMGIVGESGCGKSTVSLGIMRDLSNIGKIVGGKIKFQGKDMGELSDEELRSIRGNKIAMIYQEPMASLNPAMKVGQQLMEVPLIHDKVSKEEAYKRALEMVRSVKLPDPERMMRSYPHQLSGGQQQRIVIAMALLSKPALLLLDEPTTALDVTVEAGIVDLVKGLGEKFGTSMIFVSHNLGLILETCDRITVMYSGEAVETGKIKDVFDRMRHPYTQGLFRSIPLPGADKNSRPLISIPGQLPLPHERPKGCNFGPRCHHFVEGVCNAAEIPMIEVAGHEGHFSRCVRFNEIDWEALPPGAKKVNERVVPGAPVLKIEDLRKYYRVGGSEVFGSSEGRVVKANETISFMARESETVAIVGESGCGKSTLAKVLLGLETASAGTVTLGNTEIQSTGIEKRSVDTVSSIQMVFQNPFDTLNPSHSVGSQIIRTLEKFNVGKTVADRRKRMLELLDLVKLPRAFETRKPRQLSGGQKQRIGVARAFAGDAKVVVADEPVSALDVSVQAAVTELLMDIQRKNKTTMLFISHDLSVVRYIADRVVVMYLGYIVEQGTTDQIFAPPYHPYTEALLSAIPIADTSVVKRHIVLEGDIPSAMNPPSGCPFQTRCGYKKLVPDNLCETKVPPVKHLGGGHMSLCWLSDDVLAKMEPVIKFDKEHAAHEGVPDDAPHGDGPGFAGTPPKRPRGKTGSAAADAVGQAAEEAEAVSKARRHEVRDEVSETGRSPKPGKPRKPN
ncbi:ABC transporter ATP-binding protein [Mesorhizobium sp. M7A.F.Ca.CA.004.11.2.1]|uniref:dipeptide ABC transporter ATP-binding protein n=12 Tax=Phyllobacteriaceae TaxID=69277 RepID=UPI000FCBD777|nr:MULTISPECIES: ABC transporter ATP-binding protein [Mesorhizobium]MCF6123776.1 ABC transporter ATP-binding protein [Mesorhizobium ciceri]MCQ8812900.1 ABC transporter ATP-binding protein [Mesorhizobium sp. SEMIA396]RUX76619.1 ABC transporter ATP-binding protein [Mesorhizobium sp. M7A.F.Ca.CA.004.08.2.1]RUX84177.1 ABC transporter ATP-binding protein [Mesorhizobium sp. M7A.F.Ca.CA.004.08.1.1]RVA27193.1 ABC transporter ATP-binding protein [Mesorhizobium sp. M7A.F.Ca.CA.004.11.2.1]